MKINRQQITDKVSKLPIEELALQFGFQKRKPRKIDGVSFVTGFLLMLHHGGNSFSDWARGISQVIGKIVSKQAVEKKLQLGQIAFAKQLLGSVLKQSLNCGGWMPESALFKCFNKVYLEDSTCLKLPSCLARFFPGPHSSRGPCASLRIQLRMELLSQSYEGFDLQSYREVDQKHAGAILQVLQAGNLVIRDLGYWALEVFRLIIDKQAYFLTRYKYGTICMDADSKERIDLLQVLKKLDRNGIQVLDRCVLLGKKERLPVRLVAIKVPQNVYLTRRRRAKKDRCQSINHSKEYMELLGWTIFITNVDKQVWTFLNLVEAYRFRWRIEVVFKCWKSKFNLKHLFADKRSISLARVVITSLLFLVYLTAFFVPWATFFISQVYRATQKWVSILKFADFVKEHFVELITAKNLSRFIPQVAYYCSYEKRKKRSNYLELFYMLNLS